MSGPINSVIPVTMPQVNVNDETATLIAWHVPDGGHAVAGQPLCEIETSKSTGDVPAPATGILQHAARVGQVVAVGQVIAYLGPSVEAIRQHLARIPVASAAPTGHANAPAPAFATAGAVALARSAGIDIRRVPAAGRLRRADVERYLADHPDLAAPPPAAPPADDLPPALRDLVTDEPDLPDPLWTIARHLAATQRRLLPAHVALDVNMDRAAAWLDDQRRQGRLATSIPLLIHAAAAAARTCPGLVSFRLGRRVCRYTRLDIAFTARSPHGRLFTPVVRDAARPLHELADDCARLAMAAFRHELDPRDLTGGAMTVSALSNPPVRFHVGLANAWQSALLTAGAIREEVAWAGGRPVRRLAATLVLTYDHGLMDGHEAADALAAAASSLENLNVS